MQNLSDADLDTIESEVARLSDTRPRVAALSLISDLRHARAALRQIQSAAGAPDAADACRNVIKIAERALLGVADV